MQFLKSSLKHIRRDTSPVSVEVGRSGMAKAARLSSQLSFEL